MASTSRGRHRFGNNF